MRSQFMDWPPSICLVSAWYLPGVFAEDQAQPDLSIAATRNQDELRYPSYTVIQFVTADGSLCA